MATKLSKGTRICFNGSTHVIVLAEDAKIEEIADQTYVGLLVADRENNWPINIDNVDGKYSPVTGAREPDESVANEEAVAETPEIKAAQKTAIKKAVSAKKAAKTPAKKRGSKKANEKAAVEPKTPPVKPVPA